MSNDNENEAREIFRHNIDLACRLAGSPIKLGAILWGDENANYIYKIRGRTPSNMRGRRLKRLADYLVRSPRDLFLVRLPEDSKPTDEPLPPFEVSPQYRRPRRSAESKQKPERFDGATLTTFVRIQRTIAEAINQRGPSELLLAVGTVSRLMRELNCNIDELAKLIAAFVPDPAVGALEKT